MIPIPDPFGRKKRNLTGDLIEGASDGAVKKAKPNWCSPNGQDASDSSRSVLSHVEGGYDWSAQDGDKASYVRGYVRGA